MNKQSEHTSRMDVISLVVLVVVTAFTALYMKGLNSGIPYYYDSIGYSATIGGTFVAVFTLASTVMRLVGGQITDHFSHYRILMASLLGLLLGVAIPAVWDDFFVVMVSRVLQGAAFALATNVMTVAVMSTASMKHMGRRMGIKGAGTSLGTMFGALVATGLLDGIGFQGFFGFYVALMLAAILMVFLLKRAERAGAKRAQQAAAPQGEDASAASTTTTADAVQDTKREEKTPPATQQGDTPALTFGQRLRALIKPYLMPQVFPFLAMSFARRMPKGFCISFILIFARYTGIEMGALFFVVAGATTLTCRLLGGKLFDSEKAWLLLPVISAQIVGFALLAAFPSLVTLIVAAVGYGISVGLSSPFIKTLTAKSAPKEHWGVVNGELYFFGDMGKALGAFLGGIIIDMLSKSLIPEIALGFSIVTSVLTAIALIADHRAKCANGRS